MGYLGYFKMYSEKEMYLGGLMVVDSRGIPVEFKYTDTIKPSKLQKVLYGGVLEKYLKEEVIIGNLVDKLEIKPEIYVVDKIENMVLNKFVKEHKRQPEINSNNDFERRLAIALAMIKEEKRKRNAKEKAEGNS